MSRFKNSFVWQFVGGFALGAAGLLAFQQPVESAYPDTAAAVRQTS